MSNRSKGNAFELKIKKYLESVGFTVDKARAALKFVGPGKFFSSPCDFFGAADLIAVHPGKPYTLFVQAHAGDNHAQRRHKLEAVPWNVVAHRVQLWLPAGDIRGGIRVLAYDIEAKDWREFFFRLTQGEEPTGGVL